jgi:hypothetical protein
VKGIPFMMVVTFVMFIAGLVWMVHDLMRVIK